MKIMQETTVWSDGGTGNHIYVFNDSMTQIIAYVPRGSTKVQKFKHPIAIDVRGRKFEELDDTPSEPDLGVVTVEGSNGKKYYLGKPNGQWVCSCPGYTFRGTCKHVNQMEEAEAA